MRIVVERTPGSSWFYFFKTKEGIRDLGDYIIGFLKFEFHVWVKKPYWNKKYKRLLKEQGE